MFVQFFHSLLHSPVATDPTIVSLEQVSATTVRVEWSQPSGGASVTGYTVHYSDGSTDRSMSASSISADITGLTNGRTYSISVEAASEHLSGQSETMTIALGECFFSDIRFESNGLESSTDHTLYMYKYTQNSKVLYILSNTVQNIIQTHTHTHTHSATSSSSRGCECE